MSATASGKVGQRHSALRFAQNTHAFYAEIMKFMYKEKDTWPKVTGKWTKPETGVLKINCDGSFQPTSGEGGWGFVIRDHDGDVIQAGRGKLNPLMGAFQVELMACLHGAKTASNLGMGTIEIETDAIKVK